MSYALEDIIDDALQQSSSFSQGTGATARSAWDKMRDVVSVLDFGAVRSTPVTGIVDTTAAFQAAIDYVREQVRDNADRRLGGYVYIPAGRYWISNIRMKTRVGIIGESRGSVILTHYDVGGHTGGMITLDNNAVNTTDIRNIHLSGAGDTSVNGIEYINANDTNDDNFLDIGDPQHRIYDCDFYGFTGEGTAVIINSRETHMRNCFIAQSTFGLEVRSSDSWFTDISINWIQKRGLVVTGGNNTFTKVKCWYIGTSATYGEGDGIVLDSSNNILMGCQCQDISRHGLYIEGNNENVIRGLLLDNIGNFKQVSNQGIEHPSSTNVSAIYVQGAAQFNTIDFLLTARSAPTTNLNTVVWLDRQATDNYIQVMRQSSYLLTGGVDIHGDGGNNATNKNVVQINGREANFLVTSVAASADDAHETISGGAMSLTATTVGMQSARLCGFRFEVPTLPQGAVIRSAKIQFGCGGSGTGEQTLTIAAEGADAAVAFTTGTGDISGRSLTSATEDWVVPDWTANDRNADQLTPDLKTVVQEVVDRVGFDGVLLFVFSASTANGRTVTSYDGSATLAPTLTVIWE